MKKTLLMFCCLATISHSYAGGYRVSIQGQKALGMGHAGVAMSSSSEAVFFNPGVLTKLPNDFELVTGISLVDTENIYQNSDTGTSAGSDNPLGTPVSFYVTKKYNDQISLGFGLYTPYGSKVEWDQDWAGSHLIQDIDLRSIFLQPTLAYQINDRLSIGGGPIIAVSSVNLNRNLSTSLQNANGRSNVTLDDDKIIDYGYNLGAHFTVSDKLNIGINYRSEIKVKSEGDADFDNIPGPLAAVFANGGYTARLPLPAELTLGFTYRINKKLLLAADYNYTFWDAYENLTIEFDSVADPSRATNVNPRNYRNSSIYRVGVEYQANKKLQLRGGMYYDQTPIRDGFFAPETPRTDSLGFTGGLTYQVNNNFAFDMSLLYLYFDEEDNSYDFSDEGVFAGSYKINTWALGLGVTHKF